jgi:hypothetical protein
MSSPCSLLEASARAVLRALKLERQSAGEPRGNAGLAETVEARGTRVLAGAPPCTVWRYTWRQQKALLSVLSATQRVAKAN